MGKIFLKIVQIDWVIFAHFFFTNFLIKRSMSNDKQYGNFFSKTALNRNVLGNQKEAKYKKTNKATTTTKSRGQI